MNAHVINDALLGEPNADGVYVVEASEVGLKPGQWPEYLTVTCGEPVCDGTFIEAYQYQRGSVRSDWDGNVQSVDYVHDDADFSPIRIIND